MLTLKTFKYKSHEYICQKDVHLGYYKTCNVIFESGRIVFLDYTSKSVSATIKKFKKVIAD